MIVQYRQHDSLIIGLESGKEISLSGANVPKLYDMIRKGLERNDKDVFLEFEHKKYSYMVKWDSIEHVTFIPALGEQAGEEDGLST